MFKRVNFCIQAFSLLKSLCYYMLVFIGSCLSLTLQEREEPHTWSFLHGCILPTGVVIRESRLILGGGSFPMNNERRKLQQRPHDDVCGVRGLCCLGGFREKHFLNIGFFTLPLLSQAAPAVIMSDSVVCNTLISLGSVAYKSSIKTVDQKITLNLVLRFGRCLFNFVQLQGRHPCKLLSFKASFISSLIHKFIFH